MTSASTALLVDSNILVYSVDHRVPWKRMRALSLLDQLERSGRLALSVQCLTEFYRVSTRRLPRPLSPDEAFSRIRDLAQTAMVHELALPTVIEACRVAGVHSISIWDALIWAVARLNRIPHILTEDVPAPEIEGVGFVNPFAPEFEPARYGIELAS
jgi:predicted nucleic acid-binding protein